MVLSLHVQMALSVTDGVLLVCYLSELHKLQSVLLQTLRSLQPVLRTILQQQPLQVHVKGLEYMNDDPSAMHVAYVGVQDPAQEQGCVQKLQQLCTAVVDAFSDAGLLLSRDER